MSNESLIAAVITSSDDRCDESKCVSIGLNSIFDFFDTPLTCYSNVNLYPMACSDGYLPHIVDNEPAVIRNEYKWGTTSSPPLPYHYFTCCPPDLPINTTVSRHCSNTSLVINETTDICENNTQPRRMASYGDIESFVCCDSSILENTTNNNTTSFLNNTECVPFYDDTYSPTIAKNTYGHLQKVYCDNKGIYIDFKYPRKVKSDNQYGIFHYECCKIESTELPPFIRNSAFNKTIYPQIVISTIAVLLCLLLIVALSIPLFLHLKNKREQTTGAITSTSTSRRIQRSLRTTSSTRPTTATNNTRTNRRQQNVTVPTYGSYNLYLIYLAIPDLILNICLLVHCGKTVNQKITTTIYTYALTMACSTANLYINCVISYEILTLLRNSNNIVRSRPPSLIKVTLQSMTVYFFSVCIFIAIFYTHKIQREDWETGIIDEYDYFFKVNLSWSMIVCFTLPIIFFCYVWITIWYRGYIQLSSVTGAMKELVWYFFRIFVVFNLIWLPGVFLTVFGGTYYAKYSNLVAAGYLFCGIQPIVSTSLAMMKHDVRKYTIDLLTLSYIRKAPESTPTPTTTTNMSMRA